MTGVLTVLTAEDVVASAVATTTASSGAYERVRTMASALQAGVADRGLWDSRCARRFDVLGFIRHCADVDHTLRDVELDDAVPDERWLGRQGESRTAVARW